VDRRGQIKDMQSIHIRPPEIVDRLIPGHWEGDLINGEGNRSSLGTLVERTTRFVSPRSGLLADLRRGRSDG
jgi:IS30 family transposase